MNKKFILTILSFLPLLLVGGYENFNITTKGQESEQTTVNDVYLDENECLVVPEGEANFKASNNGKSIYAVNGKIIVNEGITDEFGIKSLENLTEVKCGVDNYDQFSYCAKVKFFNSDEKKTFNKELFKPNNPTNINEYLENYMQDFALVLIEGCVLCKDKTKPINILFYQNHKEGPIKPVCADGQVTMISNFTFNLNNYNNGGFITGGILNERLCPTRKTINDEIQFVPLSYTHKFSIIIEHSCNGLSNTRKIYFVKEIDYKNVENHVFELRGLLINLTNDRTDMEEIFDWNWENKNKGLGYNYYTAISPAELKKLRKEKESDNITSRYLEANQEHLSENNEEENMENKEVFNEIRNKMNEDNMEEENEEKDEENITLEESTTMKSATEEKKKE
uniref:Transmembrane protein n=1 Tax=Meloidogyne javanica TaxID=6303 RepID=A0A915MDF6_MELJA